LHIAAWLEVANFLAFSSWIIRFKRRHNTVYRILSGKSRSVDPETVEGSKNYQLLQENEGYDLCDIHNANETGIFFSLQPRKIFTFQGDFCHDGTKSREHVTVLLACNADGSDIKVHVVSWISKDCLQNMKLIEF
jgi:hypothetical protein